MAQSEDYPAGRQRLFRWKMLRWCERVGVDYIVGNHCGQRFTNDFNLSRSIVRVRFSFWTRYRALLIVQLQTKRLLQGIRKERFAVRRRIRPR